MPQISKLPEKVKSDISIFLAPEEKLLKAVSSLTTGTGQAGQVWLILTSHSVFFHTCQSGKDPVIALVERKALREIEYFQRPEEIVLTFVPALNPQNTTRLPFSIEKRAELESFCEDLADLISFKKETPAGVKTYTTPKPVVSVAPIKTKQTPQPLLRNATSATRTNQNPAQDNTHPEAKPLPVVTEQQPDVKIVEKPSVTPSAHTVRIQPAGSKTTSESSAGFKPGYIIAATLISVAVGFLWYQFFKFISNRS